MPLVVAEAVWQYTSHVLPGLTKHRGPILTLANWSGQWPGLVGLLNLNGSLTKAGIRYSSIWSETFDDEFARSGLAQWLATAGSITTPATSRRFEERPSATTCAARRSTAPDSAGSCARSKAIMGIFDEGCMGMYNAIIPDDLLHATGVFKERLSQSALYAAMRDGRATRRGASLAWLRSAA